MFEPIPDEEMPDVLAAITDGRCCVCFGPILPEHGGLYCCAHDDGCSHRWETITGTSHVVEHTPVDRDEYPLARPGDRVVRLEAEAPENRLGFTFTVPGDVRHPEWLFVRYMDLAARQLETAGAS